MATVTLTTVPPTYINENFDVTFTFDNTGSQIYFLPAIEVYLPKEADIPSLPIIATWNGLAWITPTNTILTSFPGFPDVPLLPGTAINDTYRNFLLGYSSYGPNQPELEFIKSMIIQDPSYVLGNTYTARTRGIFLLGDSPTYDPILHPPIISSVVDLVVAPVPYAIIKTVDSFVGDHVQPTGPSYPISTTLTLHIAPNQTITETIVQDTLDAAFRYIPGSVVNPVALTQILAGSPAPGEYFVPVYNGTLIWNLGSRTGAVTTGSTFAFQYNVYTSYYEFGSNTQVLDSVNPASSINIPNTANLYDGAIPLVDSNTVQVPVGPLALAKTVMEYVPVLRNLAGTYLQYTLTMSVSNYFAFHDLVVEDLMSAGQIFLPPNDPSTLVPTITIPGMGTVNMTPAQVAVTGVPPIVPTPPYFPTTQVIFTTPDILYAGTIYQSQVANGFIPNDEGILGQDLGAYQVIITYYCQLDNQYTPTPPLLPVPFNNLGAYAYVNNTGTLTATNVDIATGQDAGTVTEQAEAEFVYPNISITKTIYAYNGVVGPPPDTVFPGDTITYRLIATLPIQNFVDLVIRDFLPPPIMSDNEFVGASFPINTGSAVPPAAGNVSFGPLLSVTTNGPTYLPPTVSVSNIANAVIFDFGTYQDTAPNHVQVLDILLTATVTYRPFLPGLRFSNQAVLSLDNITGGSTILFDTVVTILGQPDLQIKKSAVDSSSLTTTIANRATLVNMYGAVNSPSLGPGFVPIDPAYFDAFVGSDVFNADANNTLRYVILLENDGTLPAYDVSVQDFITTELTYTGNLLAFDQDGVAVPISASTAPTVGGTNIDFVLTNPIPVDGLVIIIYQIITGPSVTSCDVLYNLATISSWANVPDGSNFVTTLGLVRQDRSDIFVSNVIINLNYLGTVSGVTSGNNVTLGDIAQFTITAAFPMTTAPGSTISVSVPTGLVFTPGTVTHDPGVTYTNDPPLVTTTSTGILWDFGTLTSTVSGAMVTLPFTAMFPSSNAALVNGTNVRFSVLYNSDLTCASRVFHTFRVVEPNVTIVKSINPATSGLGVTYDITLHNIGTSPAFDMNIVDNKPAQFGPAPFTIVAAPPYIDNSTPTQLNITLINPIPVGGTAVITISNTITAGTPHGTTITNTVVETYKSLDLDDGSERIYTGSSTVTITITPRLIVIVSDATYGLHNADYGGRDEIVGAVGDRMNYNVQWFVPPGTEIMQSLTMQFPANFVGLEPELASVAVIRSDPNSYDGTQLEMSVIYDNSGLVTFQIDTTYVNTSTTDVIFEWNYYFRIGNSTTNTQGTYYNPTVLGHIVNADTTVIDIIPVVPPSVTDFYVVEPNISIIKTGPTLPILPGGVLSYTLTITNPKLTWTSSAFQLIVDDKSFNLPNIFASVTGGNVIIPGAPLEIRYILDKLVPGGTLVLPITATLLPGQPNEDFYFNNIATAVCRSVAIDSVDTTYARTGLDGYDALNGYFSQDAADVQLIVPRITKTRVPSDCCGLGDPVVQGQVVQYAITVTLPLGVFPTVILTDNFTNLTFNNAVLDASNFDGVIAAPVITPGVGTFSAVFFNVTATGPNTTFILNVFFTVTGPVGQNIDNSVTLSGSGLEGSATAPPDPIVGPELYITKERLTDPVISNQPIQYVVSVGHTLASQADAVNVIITDVPSQGLDGPFTVTFVPPPQLPFTLNPLTIPLLSKGTTVEITYSTTLLNPPALSGSNTASVSYNGDNTLNATNEYIIASGELSLTKTPSSATAHLQDIVLWNLSYTNTGNSPLNNVVLTEDAVPSWVTPMLNSPPSSPGWMGVGLGPFTLNIGTLLPGQTGVAILAVQIGLNVPPDVSALNNTASITGTDLNEQSHTTDASATVYIIPNIVPLQRLSINKVVTAGSLVPGGFIAYDIIVTNTGNVPYVGPITVTDIIPPGTLWNHQDGWIQNGTQLSQTLNVSLLPGESVTLHVYFTILGDFNLNDIINVANVMGNNGLFDTVTVITPLGSFRPPCPPLYPPIIRCCPPPKHCCSSRH